MELVYLMIGLGVGILLGALLQDRVQRDKESSPQELARLLKQATADLNKDEMVSITLSAGKYLDDDEGDAHPSDDLPNIERQMLDKWREN